MQRERLVSIIIPIYNREHILKASVESCLAQTYRHIEIIAVDDCSTDNSVNVVKEMMTKDSRIKLLQNEKNSNPAFSRNAGISAAKGQLITFLDSDDLILPNKIEECVNAYEATGADCINAPVISQFYNDKDEISVIVPGDDLIYDYLTRKVVWKIIGPVWSRKYVDTIGWFNIDAGLFGTEDFEFHMRAIIHGVNVHYLTQPLSVQVNVDPAIDKAKIRQARKFEKVARRKILSRVLVLKCIMGSSLPSGKKVKYVQSISRYILSLLKRSYQNSSARASIKLTGFLIHALFRKVKSKDQLSVLNAG